MNKWNYTEGNPVNYTDPSGQFLDTVLDVGFLAYDVIVLTAHIDKGCDTLKDDLIAVALDAAGFAIPFVTGLGAVRHIATKLDDVGDVIRYAPAVNYGKYGGIGSGLTRNMQRILVSSLDDDAVIAVRSRPYLAHLLDGIIPAIPAKAPQIEEAMIAVKYKNGVRLLKPEYGGIRILSDLDIAGYTRGGINVIDQKFLLGFRRRFNAAYHPIITHGTLVNGLKDANVTTKLGSKRIRELKRNIVFIFDKTGFIGKLPYTEYVGKYVKGVSP